MEKTTTFDQTMKEIQALNTAESAEGPYPSVFLTLKPYGDVTLTFFATNNVDTIFAAIGVGEGSSESLQTRYFELNNTDVPPEERKRLVAVINRKDTRYSIRVEEFLNKDYEDLFQTLEQQGAFFSNK